MFSIKSFVNKITDKGAGRESVSDASTAPAYGDQEEQHSAEGFLCPLCMTAYPSPESLAEHYQKTHGDSVGPTPSHSNSDFGSLKEEILELQLSLADERNSSDELRREVLKMQADFHSKEEMDNASLKSQEKENDGAINLLKSEVTLLRQQLQTELEKVSQLKKEKELFGDKLLKFTASIEKQTQEISSLELQLAHRNTVDDSAVLKTELVSVQKMMDQMAMERESEIAELKTKLGQHDETLNEKDINYEAKMQETISKYDVKIKEYAVRIEKSDKELRLIQSNAVAKEKQFLEELNSAKNELSGTENSRKVAEHECTEMRAEIWRLQDQHSELYKKIQGGDGAQAALDSFRKENETLTQNLLVTQVQNKELTKNQYNLRQDIEKLSEDYAKLIQMYETLFEEGNVKHTIYLEMVEQRNECQVTSENLKKLIEAKESELEILRAVCDEQKKKIKTMVDSIEASTEVETRLRQTSSELESKLAIANDSATSSDTELVKLKRVLDKLTVLSEKNGKAAEEANAKLKHVEVTNQNLQTDLSNLESSLEESKVNAKSQIQIYENKLEGATEAYSAASKRLEAAERAHENIQVEILKKDEIQVEKSRETDDLKLVISKTKSELFKSEEKVQQLQVQTDEVLTEKIDLENKFKLSEEGKSLLLERCLSGESESERLQETINELRRKLEDSNSALHELGRENQSWQMENAKAQGRKWTDDSSVTNCTSCSKEFTLTIRKHHCRHCGLIFCNECSSRSASVPSCKKPARVCETCFDELSSK